MTNPIPPIEIPEQGQVQTVTPDGRTIIAFTFRPNYPLPEDKRETEAEEGGENTVRV